MAVALTCYYSRSFRNELGISADLITHLSESEEQVVGLRFQFIILFHIYKGNDINTSRVPVSIPIIPRSRYVTSFGVG